MLEATKSVCVSVSACALKSQFSVSFTWSVAAYLYILKNYTNKQRLNSGLEDFFSFYLLLNFHVNKIRHFVRDIFHNLLRYFICSPYLSPFGNGRENQTLSTNYTWGHRGECPVPVNEDYLNVGGCFNTKYRVESNLATERSVKVRVCVAVCAA